MTSNVTVLGAWEPGFSDAEQRIEFRIWKQLIQGYDVSKWIMVGENRVGSTLYDSYLTYKQALSCINGKRVFFQPRGQIELSEYVFPDEELALCFGNAHESMDAFTGTDDCIRISTPEPHAQFACTILSTVLYELKRQNREL